MNGYFNIQMFSLEVQYPASLPAKPSALLCRPQSIIPVKSIPFTRAGDNSAVIIPRLIIIRLQRTPARALVRRAAAQSSQPSPAFLETLLQLLCGKQNAGPKTGKGRGTGGYYQGYGFLGKGKDQTD